MTSTPLVQQTPPQPPALDANANPSSIFAANASGREAALAMFSTPFGNFLQTEDSSAQEAELYRVVRGVAQDPRLKDAIAWLTPQEQGKILASAVRQWDEEVLRQALQAGVDPNAPISKMNSTALMPALAINFEAAVDLLIDKTDVNRVNGHGERALDIACRAGHQNENLLLKLMPAGDGPVSGPCLPLLVRATTSESALRVLLRRCDVFANDQGETALGAALSRETAKSFEQAKALLEEMGKRDLEKTRARAKAAAEALMATLNNADIGVFTQTPITRQRMADRVDWLASVDVLPVDTEESFLKFALKTHLSAPKTLARHEQRELSGLMARGGPPIADGENQEAAISMAAKKAAFRL